MIDFSFSDLKLIALNDKKRVNSYTQHHQLLSCEYSFANLMCWSTTYNNHIAEYGDRLVLYCQTDDDLLMPLGENIMPKELLQLSQAFQHSGKSGCISQVPPQYIQQHPELSDNFEIEECLEFADYIYTSESLFNLNGSKLNKKRNLIKQFEKNYPKATVKIIDSNIIDQCRRFMIQPEKVAASDHHGLSEEERALTYAFDHFDELNLIGISILHNENVIAAALLSESHSNTAITHYEKADISYKGIYQFLNRETARKLHNNYPFINREPDLGIEGLRRAKQSYQPHTHLVNYLLTPKSNSN